jgi:hypothetical protein
MSRFQALIDNALEEELEMLRAQLGIKPSQNAELLREIAGLAAWVVHRAHQGRSVEARCDGEVETLRHPTLDRLRIQRDEPVGACLPRCEYEISRLTSVLDRGFDPPPALRRALANLADPKRSPPNVRWRKSAI